ncbi:hypothetical protein PR003_g30206, partial [Phytophthora rubi]
MYQAGQAVQFRHTDEDSLATFLQTLQSEITVECGPTTNGVSRSAEAALLAVDTAPVAEAESTVNAQVNAPRADALPVPDGFRTAKRKGGKVRLEQDDAIETIRLQQGGPVEDQRPAKAPTPSVGKTSSMGANTNLDAPVMHRLRNRKAATKRGEKAPRMQTFNQFKRAIARGRFAALSDPSPEGSELDSEEEDAEAPYAYTDAPRLSVTEDTRTQIEKVTNTSADPMGIGHTETGNGAQNSQGSPTEALQLPGPANTGSIVTEISEMDVDAVENSDQESELSGYVGSSAPSCTQSPAPTPGSEVAYSIDLEAEAARERQLQEPDSIGGSALPAAATLGDTQGDISQTPAHSLSQD